jgi:hypothetical protein
MPPARRSLPQQDAPEPETLLAAYPPAVQALAHELRRVVGQSVPGVIERVATGWRLIGYRVHDGRHSYYFCFIAPRTDSVRLGFEYGVLLSDQTDLEGDGRQVRFVTVRTLQDIVIARLAPLITEAAMVAVSRRGPNVP